LKLANILSRGLTPWQLDILVIVTLDFKST
jgi:hypothetical protein